MQRNNQTMVTTRSHAKVDEIVVHYVCNAFALLRACKATGVKQSTTTKITTHLDQPAGEHHGRD